MIIFKVSSLMYLWLSKLVIDSLTHLKNSIKYTTSTLNIEDN